MYLPRHMEFMSVVIFAAGAVFGAVVVWIVMRRQKVEARAIAEELLRDNEARKQAELDRVIEHVKLSFGSLSTEALNKANEEFVRLRKSLLESDRTTHTQELDSKKALIDEQLKSIAGELSKVEQVVKGYQSESATRFGQLDSGLRAQNEQVQKLALTTGSLREALSSTKARGQWGERMAEDVLRLAGFVEGINYEKQKTLGAGTRPDFTFPLPQGLMLNMDVKFPLDNYRGYIEATSETDAAKYRADFVRDLRNHVKAVSGREYINAAEHTVDYVLLFIPNEQVYSFIHEVDRSLLDDALKSKVILCSPLSLYAILAVIRQASDNFAFEQASEQILSAVATMQTQWRKFVEKMDVIGKRIEDSQKAFQELMTTRKRALDRAFDKVEDLRSQRGLPLLSDGSDNDQSQ